ncbi:unnamed protein product [Toxocara canis]|uniref:CC domain-containing protein n=1 Tax=Toxocara canis TaxID=6265 RepID=A0A183UAE7_TOXCA|nr:unnamed protein product [Toxocara canis]
MLKWLLTVSLLGCSKSFIFGPMPCIGSGCGLQPGSVCPFGSLCNNLVFQPHCDGIACAQPAVNYLQDPCISSNCGSLIPLAFGSSQLGPCGNEGTICSPLNVLGGPGPARPVPVVAGSLDPCHGISCSPGFGAIPLMAGGGGYGLLQPPFASPCGGIGCGSSSQPIIIGSPPASPCSGSFCSSGIPLPFPLGANPCDTNSNCTSRLPAIIIIDGPPSAQNLCSFGSAGCTSGYLANSPLMTVLRGVSFKKS